MPKSRLSGWIEEWDGEMAFDVVTLDDLGIKPKRGGANRKKLAEFQNQNVYFSNIVKDGKAYTAEVRTNLESDSAGTYRLPVRWGEKAYNSLQKLPKEKRESTAVAVRIELTPKGSPQIKDHKS